DGRPRSSSAAVFPAVIAPWIVIFASLNSPTVPLTTVWRHCVKKQGEKRAKAIAPYLSRRLKESTKYQILLNIDPIAVNKVTQPDKTQRGEIVFILKDGREYACTTVKRDNLVDGTGTGNWVLDDIRGHEFANKGDGSFCLGTKGTVPFVSRFSLTRGVG
ncbi:MAG: hypothetical protein Q8S19_04205, partial [Bacillota bacterium]|nr:hypothetical protein [Bacillota bacterium]